MSAELLQNGDRFTCESFADATMTSEVVNSRLVARPDMLTIGGSRGVIWHEKKEIEGWDGHVTRKQSLGLTAYDLDRATAVFVVVKCRLGGGGCAHGPYDRYDDGWQVEAKREGHTESIRFSQSGCFRDYVDPEACVLAKLPEQSSGIMPPSTVAEPECAEGIGS